MLGHRARLHDQLVVLHARWARGHTRHAAEATIEVLEDRLRQLPPLGQRLHQIDAATRRIHLLSPRLIRGAGRQTKTAVHAVVDQLALDHSPPTKQPGLSRRSGSKRIFISSMMRKEFPTGPQASMPLGTVSIINEPSWLRAEAKAGAEPLHSKKPIPNVAYQAKRDGCSCSMICATSANRDGSAPILTRVGPPVRAAS